MHVLAVWVFVARKALFVSGVVLEIEELVPIGVAPIERKGRLTVRLLHRVVSGERVEIIILTCYELNASVVTQRGISSDLSMYCLFCISRGTRLVKMQL